MAKTKKTKPMTNADFFKAFCHLSPLAQGMIIQGVTGQFEAVIKSKNKLLKEGAGSPIISPHAWISAAEEIKQLHNEYQASH